MKVLAIIQARMSSTRLPGKVFKMIEGKRMIDHVIDRVSSAKLVDEVVVATTINKADLKIIGHCAKRQIRVFTGSEDDVLERYYHAARLYEAENVLRITADCPIIDPKRIDEVLRKHLKNKADYTGNTVVDSFPDGYDCEVSTFEALEISHKKANLASEREHLTQYIRKRPNKFKIESIVFKKDISKLRFTVDNPEDLKLARAINKELYKKNKVFSLEDVLELLDKRPELIKINSHLDNNLGLKKSLAEDKVIKKKG